ncbi:transmembrane protein 53 [Tetranychus urticae]|uniref:Transmembrane protein 53 n=1 Tax=Tetranychus urticae TaxID=32264 RepID=T1L082_TETUR|nr:transmembrane protein 53 [Tetranychus urticae]XP_015792273.1 transmembrane protein 53 [Tetranychus urticae]XP_015792274.1 transmembrane protein 53 [Tetranychus urticae]
MSFASFSISHLRCFSGAGRSMFQIGIKPCLHNYLSTSSYISIRLKHGKANKHGVHFVNKNLSIKYANSVNQDNKINHNTNGGSDVEVKPASRLLVLIAWIRAAEKNLEKYREIYIKNYGFDVLTVYTNPIDFLLPTVGTQKTAQNLVDYLVTEGNKYSDIVIHGFSVGAYEFGEILIILNKALEKSEANSAYHKLIDTIRGMVFDSAVDVSGAPIGVSRSVGGETFLADAIQIVMRFYMWLASPVATKHYVASSKMFHNNFLRCPALLLFSKQDAISDTKVNMDLAEEWKNLGINVTVKDFNHSRHVTHYRKYPDLYGKQIDDFITKLSFISDK